MDTDPKPVHSLNSLLLDAWSVWDGPAYPDDIIPGLVASLQLYAVTAPVELLRALGLDVRVTEDGKDTLKVDTIDVLVVHPPAFGPRSGLRNLTHFGNAPAGPGRYHSGPRIINHPAFLRPHDSTEP